MKLIREIVVYQKDGDKHIESIEIYLSVDELVSILNINVNEDSKAYIAYMISEEQYLKFQKIIPSLKEIDFNTFELFYECSHDK